MDIGEDYSDCSETKMKLFSIKLHADLEVWHPSFHLLFLPPADVTLLLEAGTDSGAEADF